MSRIEGLFKTKPERILSVYCTAGYPLLESTGVIMKTLQDNGADMIELGMPYSDPLADGEIIQASSAVALQNGMTIETLLKQLKHFRNDIQIPVLLMGYLNPLLQFGFEKFCAAASEAGIDGLLIPDLPMFEYKMYYEKVIKGHGLDFVFLITPETSEERIRELDQLSSGFLYAVSSSSVTGSDKNMDEMVKYLQRINQMKLKNPLLVGFGIKDRESFEVACRHSRGAIIGSAYIKEIKNASDIEEKTKGFLRRFN